MSQVAGKLHRSKPLTLLGALHLAPNIHTLTSSTTQSLRALSQSQQCTIPPLETSPPAHKQLLKLSKHTSRKLPSRTTLYSKWLSTGCCSGPHPLLAATHPTPNTRLFHHHDCMLAHLESRPCGAAPGVDSIPPKLSSNAVALQGTASCCLCLTLS